MIMLIRKVGIIIGVLLLISNCTPIEKNDEMESHFPMGSKWAYIQQFSDVEFVYNEITFKKDKRFMFVCLDNGFYGSFDWEIKGKYFITAFDSSIIIPNRDGSFIFTNKHVKYHLFRIPDRKIVNINQWDPYWIRKFNYMVQVNALTTNQAIDSLCEMRSLDSNRPSIVDEIIKINRK